jgi:hypothetical protein
MSSKKEDKLENSRRLHALAAEGQLVMPEHTDTLLLAVARDCEDIVALQMGSVFKSLESMANIKFDIVIFENDSSDGTVEAFNEVFKGSPDNVNCRIVSEKLELEAFDSVISKDRIDKMALIRNRCLDQVEDFSAYASVIWMDMDYVLGDEAFSKILQPVLLGDADIVSVYSLHGDVQRPHKELYDKWATRGKKSDTWWNCTPHELLVGLVMQPQTSLLPVYSTFNGLCAFNAKGFEDGARFSSLSKSCEASALDHDVEWISICEQFSEMGLDGIYLDILVPAYHFANHKNMTEHYRQSAEVAELAENKDGAIL